jgi:hypothetical protein
MNATTPSNNPSSASETIQMIRKDIKAKWDKFSDQDLTTLKNNDDLVDKVVAKYGLGKPQAQRDVDDLLKGRTIGHKA